MAFRPDYGETLVTEEEGEALTDAARELLGDPIRKADLYDLESPGSADRRPPPVCGPPPSAKGGCRCSGSSLLTSAPARAEP